jgi:hypothetical protein
MRACVSRGAGGVGVGAVAAAMLLQPNCYSVGVCACVRTDVGRGAGGEGGRLLLLPLLPLLLLLLLLPLLLIIITAVTTRCTTPHLQHGVVELGRRSDGLPVHLPPRAGAQHDVSHTVHGLVGADVAAPDTKVSV